MNAMSEVSIFRLYLLRAMYLLIAVGLGLTIWPAIISPPSVTANPSTVVRALLGALALLSLLSLLGLRYPLQMLPLLIFELLWKIIWIVAFALPMWLGPGLDAYAKESLFACGMGVVSVALVLPWGFIFRQYIQAPSTPWSKPPNASAGNGVKSTWRRFDWHRQVRAFAGGAVHFRTHFEPRKFIGTEGGRACEFNSLIR
jgi:hypothetical protein